MDTKKSADEPSSPVADSPLDRIADDHLATYGCPSCWGDCHACTCATDKAAIRGFLEHLKANTPTGAGGAGAP